MEKRFIGRVVEILLDKYIVNYKNENYTAHMRGNIKKNNNILVGDIVQIVFAYDKYMIEKVYDRKNHVIRPPVANIDQMIIVLAIKDPVPDYILLDKQIVLCQSKNIKPIICINKIDLDNNLEYIKEVYEKLEIEVCYVSASGDIGLDSLKEVLKNKVSAFSGNSGVGKSSIIKKILKDSSNIQIGDIASKTNKGKHTTKYIKLYELYENSYILDTPGFSSYELYDISYKNLKDYYYEFTKCSCMYDDCNHINEDEKVCDVKMKVKNGKIDFGRYERYSYIFLKLKEVEDRKYK